MKNEQEEKYAQDFGVGDGTDGLQSGTAGGHGEHQRRTRDRQAGERSHAPAPGPGEAGGSTWLGVASWAAAATAGVTHAAPTATSRSVRTGVSTIRHDAGRYHSEAGSVSASAAISLNASGQKSPFSPERRRTGFDCEGAKGRRMCGG